MKITNRDIKKLLKSFNKQGFQVIEISRRKHLDGNGNAEYYPDQIILMVEKVCNA